MTQQNRTERPLDSCECGDWRFEHRAGGTGACSFGTHNIPDRRYDSCAVFRLSLTEEQNRERFPNHILFREPERLAAMLETKGRRK